jgi:hypothetical protein
MKKNNCGCSKNNLFYNSIINMSDPSYSSDSNYSDNTTPAKPVPHKKPDNNDPSITSYFTEANIEKDIKTDMYELGLTYATSVAISVYQSDTIGVALQRGGFLVGGQLIGGLLGNALLNADYFQKGKYAQYKQYVPTALKMVTASTLYVVGNKEVLGSEQPPLTLAGEGLIASTIGHYGSQWMRKKNNKNKTKKLTQYNTVSNYDQF